jgi:hypothetical protein
VLRDRMNTFPHHPAGNRSKPKILLYTQIYYRFAISQPSVEKIILRSLKASGLRFRVSELRKCFRIASELDT